MCAGVTAKLEVWCPYKPRAKSASCQSFLKDTSRKLQELEESVGYGFEGRGKLGES